MPRPSLYAVIGIIVVGCCASSAEAGLLRGTLAHRIAVPMLKAEYRETDGELEIKGMASTANLNGSTLLHDFHLDANFDSTGLFNKKQKGSFSINNGSVVLLRGTITEANGSVFATSGTLEFLATMDIKGEFASLYRNQVGIRVDLSTKIATLQENGFAFFMSGFADISGEGEIGRPVPEPASFVAMASTLFLGLLPVGKRRRDRAKAAKAV